MRQGNKRLTKPDGTNVYEHLIDVAEKLFAQKGVAETSVRAITSEAGVNVAAINYYFGSKEDLYQAVINRRLEPLIAERVRLLDVCQQDETTGGPTVEHLLYALVSPSIKLCFAHPNFTLLASRLRVDTNEFLWADYRARQEFLKERFATLFRAALPYLSPQEVDVRLCYVLGALLQIWSMVPLPPEQSQQRLLNSFLTFYAAAFRAPEPGGEGQAITAIINSGYGDNEPAPKSQEDVHENS
jgi:AcrR family transcriptional regulator